MYLCIRGADPWPSGMPRDLGILEPFQAPETLKRDPGLL